MPTIRELDEAGVSVSRFGWWLGRHGDPADVSESAWNDDRQQAASEETHRGDADR